MTHVEIEYCVPCGLRENAVETADAILADLGQDLDGLELVPGHGGVFVVRADGEVVFDKDEEGYDREAVVARVADCAGTTA